MSTLYRLIQAFIPSFPSQNERDEAYLAEAVDIYDLERRMREIDLRARRWSAGPALNRGTP